MNNQSKAFSVMLLILTLGLVSCGAWIGGSGESGEDVTPTPAPTFVDPADSFLEKLGEDIGVKRDKNGHLLISGYPEVRILRFINFINVEATTRGKNRQSYPYKIAGLYGAAPIGTEYNDRVDYRLQISFDDFEPPVELTQIARDLETSFSPEGFLSIKNADPYKTLDALLTYRNAEASNSGDYKIKAWIERKELEGELLFDRVDILIQFSFQDPFRKPSADLAVSTRNISAAEGRQNLIIANTAVEFSQLLEKPGVLTITTLDFAGNREHGPERTYVFDERGIKRLTEIHKGNEKSFGTRDILALAEVKERVGRMRASVSDAPREKEPIGEKAIEIVAYIATETARNLSPSSGLSITVYDFTGNAPKNLTTWTYIFDGEATATIRTEDLTPQEVLKEAKVSEYAGILPGNRFIPPVKPLPSEFTPLNIKEEKQ